MSNKIAAADLFDTPGAGRTPAAQLALYTALKGNGDVPFHTLLSATQDGAVAANDPHLQQRLGPYVTRLNRRLKAARLAVRPGRLKGTYCLVQL